MEDALKSTSGLSGKRLALRELRLVYTDALEEHLADGTENSKHSACDIGRWAIAQEIGVTKVVAVHHECVGRILFRLAGSVSCKEGLRRAGDFLAEALSPYEQAHRGSSETIPALRQMNERMEREIQRIALAVHDEAGQLIYAVHLAIATAAEASSPVVHQHLAEIGAMLHRAEQGLRRLSHELRPMILDDLGLTPALQSLAERVSRTTGIAIEFEGSVDHRLDAKVETALYRIVHEALTNVVKHAHAKKVTIELQRDHTMLKCLIRDDGVGFDPAGVGKGQRGLGLAGVRERAAAVGGTLQIKSEPQRGTELLVEIPLRKTTCRSEYSSPMTTPSFARP